MAPRGSSASGASGDLLSGHQRPRQRECLIQDREVVMAQSHIASMEIIALGAFGTPPPKGTGNALVTPLSILERWPSPALAATSPLGPELYALIVALTAEDGTTGYGTVALATGGTVYTLEHHLKPLVVGADVFD